MLVGILLFSPAQAAQQDLGQMVDAIVAESAPKTGISLAVVDGHGPGRAILVGEASAGHALERTTPFRIASNTKTYVAATILRLWEDDKIVLDASIRKYVDQAYIDLLDADGYDTAAITVRQLLSHTAGIADYAQAKEYFEAILASPATAWSRDSQLKALVLWTDPLSAPGIKYSYSDTGYVLLGHIIERLTGLPLPVAVRRALKLDALNLASTYWEAQESPGPKASARAHQFTGEHDIFNWTPTLDLFGGGGLLASPEDMARFLYLLFDGKIFERPETLQTMLSKQGLPADSIYRLGIFEYDAAGTKAYGHTGFWGTAAMYVPSQRRAIAFAVTHKEAFKSTFTALAQHIGSAAR